MHMKGDILTDILMQDLPQLQANWAPYLHLSREFTIFDR
jgi:hypothetical protein